MLYSSSTGGFYSPEIHGDRVPDDCVFITDEEHSSLLSAQSSGAIIQPGNDGRPVAVLPPSPVVTKESLLLKVASIRWQIETSGISVDGIQVATDRESQSQLFSVYASLLNGFITETPWKAADGTFSMVAKEHLAPIASAVSSHVSACFTSEHAHAIAIEQLTSQSDLDNYDFSSGWPCPLPLS